MRRRGSRPASEVSRWDATLRMCRVSILICPVRTTRNNSPFLEIPGDVEELVFDVVYELAFLLRGQRLGPNMI